MNKNLKVSLMDEFILLKMEGLFEVHLITIPTKQTQLFGYITNLKNDKLIRPRPTCANSLYGDCPIQPMLTFWIKGDINEVTNEVKLIEQDMISKQIPVIRTKIESMANNKGVPDQCKGSNYFEFHFKIDLKDTKEWNKLVEIITPYGGHLFYNPYSKTLNPIVTIRRYSSLTDLEETYSKLNSVLNSFGLNTHSLEKEYSVFDSNVNLDKNWLFSQDPTNFIKEVNSNMLFSY